MTELDDETIEQINQFWMEHQDDPHLHMQLHQAYIEQECQKGNMRYKNGHNLKDGVEIIGNVCVFNPIKTHNAQMLQKVSSIKK